MGDTERETRKIYHEEYEDLSVVTINNLRKLGHQLLAKRVSELRDKHAPEETNDGLLIDLFPFGETSEGMDFWCRVNMQLFDSAFELNPHLEGLDIDQDDIQDFLKKYS